MAFVKGTSQVDVAVGGIDAAMTAASSGTVLILAPGTHTLTTTVKAGVTVRGQWNKRDNTVLHTTTTVLMEPGATIRGVTLTTDDACVFNESNAYGGRWFEDIVLENNYLFYDGLGKARWYVRRSRFVSGYLDATTGCSVDVAGCYFTGYGTPINLDTVDDTNNGTVKIYNNTFVLSSAPTIVAYNSADINIYNNVALLTAAGTDAFDFTGSNVDLGYGNYSNKDVGAYGTQDEGLELDDGRPTERFKGIAANTGHTNDLRIDYDGLPYEATRSSGAFQWQGLNSAFYRPRVKVDPIDGFTFVFDGTTLSDNAGQTTWYSHLDIAAFVRSYIYDLCHPSRAVFYTSHDGYYRLKSLAALDPAAAALTFNLTTTDDAAKVFGSNTLTGVTDTG